MIQHHHQNNDQPPNTGPASINYPRTKMHFGSILNDSLGLISKQLRFYCWHYKRNLPKKNRQELIELLHEHHFEPLANKIKLLNQSSIEDCRQQIGKLLFHHCLSQNRRNQLIQLIESNLVDINVRLDNYGNTLLHRSAYTLDVDLVKILIKQGANIRLRDSSGNTALHIAIQSYRNGAVLYGNQTDVVQNLSSILRLLLDADESLQNDRYLERNRIRRLSDRSTNSTSYSASSSTCNHKNNESSSESITMMSPKSMSHSANPLEQVSIGHAESPKIPQMPPSPPGFSTIDKHKSSRNKSAANNFSTSQDCPDFDSTSASKHCSELTPIDPILLEDFSSNLIDTKNGFGHTALHLCVLVVGEKYLDHFVQLLLSYRPDPDVIDNRMQTPLYCLVRRPGVSSIKEKCAAIEHLLRSGCDDLGLAISPGFFSQPVMNNLEQNLASIMQAAANRLESAIEPIFTCSNMKRVPKLKHLSRLRLIRLEDEKNWKLKIQKHKYKLPCSAPKSLNLYMNRKILDQSELF